MAVDQDLWCQIDIWTLVASLDFDTIRKRRQWTKRPTAATIPAHCFHIPVLTQQPLLWNVLILCNSQIVDAMDVSPEEISGKFFGVNEFVSSGVCTVQIFH